MQVTTTDGAQAARKRAIGEIARREGVSTQLVEACIAAGHRSMSRAFDSLVHDSIEAILTLAERGQIELVTQ